MPVCNDFDHIVIGKNGHHKAYHVHVQNLLMMRNDLMISFWKTLFFNRRGSGFFARISINGKEHNCIATNNHVICRKEEADAGTARFHYEGESPGEEVRLLPDQLFITDKVRHFPYFTLHDLGTQSDFPMHQHTLQ